KFMLSLGVPSHPLPGRARNGAGSVVVWNVAKETARRTLSHFVGEVVIGTASRLRWDQEMLWGRRRGDGTIVAEANRWSAPMPQPNDLSRSLVALDQDSTIIAVVEMSQSSWLVAGMLPGIERQPRKKLEPSAERLLGLLHRWRDEAVKAGRKITRI